MMTEQDISYALSKQVPDMETRGCIIGTAYGEIKIPPGRVADTVARAVTRALQCELLALTKRAQHTKSLEDKQQKSKAVPSPVNADGLDYFDRWAMGTVRADLPPTGIDLVEGAA